MPRMPRRTHYLDGWPSTHYAEGEHMPSILCGDGDPEDWSADDFRVTCPDCLLILGCREERKDGDPFNLPETVAHIHRRAELDAYLHTLEARGEATVIQVEDLGAALEAREAGASAIEYATGDAVFSDPSLIDPDGSYQFVDMLKIPDPQGVSETAGDAAHLARKALGEVGR